MNEISPWQQRALRPALGALASGRLGHALLLTGPARIGKRVAAEALARRLLCGEAEGAALACGQCRSCRLFVAGSHPDTSVIMLEENPKTGKLRTEIVVEQIRRLGEWFALTPQFGGAQVAIIDPADVMNGNAANALLKTLEEPLPGRYLLLLAARAGRLPATIRSRAQRLAFALPPTEEALAWLSERGHGGDAAEDALRQAEGHPGQALAWIESDDLALRREIVADLRALAEGRAWAASVAETWVADERLESRLRFAAGHALEQARASLTDGGRTLKLSVWFDAANRLRGLLSTPIRVDLAVAGLLHEWRLVQDSRTSPIRSRA